MTTSNSEDGSVGDQSLLLSLEVAPAQLVGAAATTATATVTLKSAAPDGGAEVQIFTDRPEVVSVPSTVRVQAGAVSETFTVDIRPVVTDLATDITAAYQDTKRWAVLTIRAQEEEPRVTSSNGKAHAGATPPTQDSPPVADPAPQASAPETAPQPSPSDAADAAWPACKQSFRAALLIALPTIPYIALVVTLGVYAAASTSPLYAFDPVEAGAITAAVLWLLLAIAHCWVLRGTAADQVNAAAFNELRHRYGEIRARSSVVTASDDPSRIAFRQLQDCIVQIKTELQRPGPVWVMGTGYISAWKLIHNAEEALLLLEPVRNVVAAALYDELRLSGAQLDNSDQLLTKLRFAVSRLSAEAANYLNARPSGTGAEANTKDAQASEPDAMSVARVALGEVRQTINEFRDNGWDAIVRTRNHLVVTLTATGIATYLGLVLAISVNDQPRGIDIQKNAVLAAGAFYLIGAMVGLFNRLNSESSTDNDVEDYGLTMARLSLTPVLAGLAAVGGVFLAAVAASGVTGAVINANNGLPGIGTIFNLSGNPFGLVLAAVFGLSPSMLISSLQDQAEKYKSALKSSSAQ